MMFKSLKSIKLAVPFIFLGLAFIFVGENQCKVNHAFSKEMKEIFRDKDLRESISKYLDRVPSSHRSRSHASRILVQGGEPSPNGTGPANTFPNVIKDVMGVVFKKGRISCKDSCNPCPAPPPTCMPCPEEDCNICAPCPLPSYCKSPAPGEKCPPKPECPVCVDSNSATTSVPSKPDEKTTAKPKEDVDKIYIRDHSRFKYEKDHRIDEPPKERENNRTTTTTTNKPSSITMEPSSTTMEPSSTTIGPSSTTMEPSSTTIGSSSTTMEPSSTTKRSSSTTTTRKSSTTRKMSTTMRPSSTSIRPSSTTKRSSSTTTTRKVSTTGKASTTRKMSTTMRPSSTSIRPSSTTKRSSSTTTTRKVSTTRKTSTTRKMSTTMKPSSTSMRPSSTSMRPSTTSMRPSTTTKRSSSTTSKTKKTSTTMSASKKVPNGSNDGKIIGNIDEKNITTKTNATMKMSNGTEVVISSTTTTTITTGVYLFEKNINSLVEDETLRQRIYKMIEAIPETTGGEEMKLARKILAQLGEKHDDPLMTTKRKGASRSFTYATARTNCKSVLGHVLERYSRAKCSCPTCLTARSCKCDPKLTCLPTTKPNGNCPPCPKNPTCPVPEGCQSYTACDNCKKKGNTNSGDLDYDDNGDPKELDDSDAENPVGKDELNKIQTCKGFTCEFEKTCGVADLNPLTPKGSQSGYMNGGEDQIYGEWPHFVRLELKSPQNRSGICGGVLISNQHVLTAGHCVILPKPGPKLEPNAITAILGDHDRTETDKFEEKHKVSSICRSQKFSDPNGTGSRYDFAVLTLEKNVTFNDHIQPACLPYKPLPLKTAKCFVVGIGVTKYDPYGLHQFASKIQKMPLARATCKNWGIKSDDRSRHCFTKARARGDTCGGDSGGPVLCLNKAKRWTVMGLVSYGSEACDGTESIGWVGVYSRIPALLKQINDDCKI